MKRALHESPPGRDSDRATFSSRSARVPTWFALLLVGVAVLAVYWQAFSFEFTTYDDPEYVTDNPAVRNGLTGSGLRWALGTSYQANWHPLTWLSLMLDAELGGVVPRVFHRTSVLLHLANSLLLLLWLDRMTRARGPSLVVAALFAVHPLHVESVAWVAERKDVLSTFFWFSAGFAWTLWIERPTWSRYLASWLLFALGLLAKPMLVTFPATLLLLDIWPFGRLRLGSVGQRGEAGVSPGRLLREKIPFFALAIVSSVVTLYAQRAGGALATLESHPPAVRVANALISYGAYLVDTVWPSGLAPFYPHPGTSVSWGWALVSSAGLAVATAIVLASAPRRPHALVGWFWYVVTLAPVIGVLQVGLQARADRYTYIPLVGIFVIIAWEIPDRFLAHVPPRQLRVARGFLWVASIAVVVVLGGLARVQANHWRDGVALFEHALAVTPDNHIARNNLGTAYYRRNGPGDLERSVEQYRAAVALRPSFALAWNNLAGALARLGRSSEAIGAWRSALQADPRHLPALCNLAGALLREGRIDEATAHCEAALHVDPEAACAHYNLAMALLRGGRIDEAGEHFEAAVRAEPQYTDSRVNLGVVRARQGRLDEAIQQFEEVLRLEPNHESARRNLEKASARKAAGPEPGPLRPDRR